MIDNTRRTIMKAMAFLGFGSVLGLAVPLRVRTTLKERKNAFESSRSPQFNGYYGFGETW